MTTNKVYVLRHGPTNTYAIGAGFSEKSFYPLDRYTPHIWNKPGHIKAAVTNFLKTDYYWHDEKEKAAFREKQMLFAINLEIVEVEIIPSTVIHKFVFDLDKISR